MEKAGGLGILHEDEWIIVVNKPEGMLSVGYPGFRGQTALDALEERYRSRGKRRITAVHRLDRETSGVMMFACSAAAAGKIMDEWQEMVQERRYRCVCVRAPGAEKLDDEGTIDLPISYNKHDVGFVPTGKDEDSIKVSERAVTRYRVLERGATCDLVECDLETGRKNQIRVHMAHLGHPVAGDEVYGSGLADGAIIDRLALHARALAFLHPFTGQEMRFEIPEPASFAKALKKKDAKKSAVPKKPMAPKKSAGARKADRKDSKGDAIAEGLTPIRRAGRYANGSKFIPDGSGAGKGKPKRG